MMKRTTKQSVTKFLSQSVTDKIAIPVLIPGTPSDYDGVANWDREKPFTQRVKICDPVECLRKGSELNRKMHKAMGRKFDKFVAVLQLRDAQAQAKEFEIDAAVRAVMQATLPVAEDQQQDELKQSMTQATAEFFSGQGRSPFNPKTLVPWNQQAAPIMLPPHFTEEIRDARFVLWYDRRRKRFTPALYCEPGLKRLASRPVSATTPAAS
jgi:hypothetical protein